MVYVNKMASVQQQHFIKCALPHGSAILSKLKFAWWKTCEFNRSNHFISVFNPQNAHTFWPKLWVVGFFSSSFPCSVLDLQSTVYLLIFHALDKQNIKFYLKYRFSDEFCCSFILTPFFICLYRWFFFRLWLGLVCCSWYWASNNKPIFNLNDISKYQSKIALSHPHW